MQQTDPHAPVHSADLRAGEELRRVLAEAFEPSLLDLSEEGRQSCATDRGPRTAWTPAVPEAVVYAESTEHVQRLMRLASQHGFPVIARGAGTALSGGGHALPGCVVLSLERMDRILSIDPEDCSATVEPGVINSHLGDAVAPYGLMYAPDPASYRISTIGGNVATNAGGLRCAKYGVTRDSVLALDVVLADGTLIRTGTPTLKGVAGYDLTALFTGSEGTLGIITGITVRLRPAPARVETAAAWFPDFPTAAAGVLAIGAARVQPAILEIMDRGTMQALDGAHGSTLCERGSAMLLVQTDGYGALEEMSVIRAELEALGGTMTPVGDAEATGLVDLRRHARGDDVPTLIAVGEDVAVPRSRLVDYVHGLERMAVDHRVSLKVVAHAGDGNLHPSFWIAADEEGTAMARLDAALDESVRLALDMGGTITGEHGIGSYKLRWLEWEQSGAVVEIQRGIKNLLDPAGILNPGRAIL
ncbi:MAG: FAD-linked oxidase C-terminal domain-containing protein [Micrococcus sp.]|nr:FAD-linked oxidase C-terminal domain-containing protein [Micrococcus sp.]